MSDRVSVASGPVQCLYENARLPTLANSVNDEQNSSMSLVKAVVKARWSSCSRSTHMTHTRFLKDNHGSVWQSLKSSTGAA